MQIYFKGEIMAQKSREINVHLTPLNNKKGLINMVTKGSINITQFELFMANSFSLYKWLIVQKLRK